MAGPKGTNSFLVLGGLKFSNDITLCFGWFKMTYWPHKLFFVVQRCLMTSHPILGGQKLPLYLVLGGP